MNEAPNPQLREAMLEIVENQLRDNDPPETIETLHRLMAEGFRVKKQSNESRALSRQKCSTS